MEILDYLSMMCCMNESFNVNILMQGYQDKKKCTKDTIKNIR